VKEEFFLGTGEGAGEEFAQQFPVDVFLHGPAGPPAEMAADEQAHAIPRLQLNHFEAVEPDGVQVLYGITW
jgi:hypothetical protein